MEAAAWGCVEAWRRRYGGVRAALLRRGGVLGGCGGGVGRCGCSVMVVWRQCGRGVEAAWRRRGGGVGAAWGLHLKGYFVLVNVLVFVLVDDSEP